MTFVFEKERMTAIHEDGSTMGTVTFPRVRAGLVNVTGVTVSAKYRGQRVAEAMLEALLNHLDEQDLKAALTCPPAQNYVANHPQWKRVLPGDLHCTTH